MQIHFGPNPEKIFETGETVAAMKEAQVEGKIHFLGASPPARLIDACLDADVFHVLQVGYNLLNREAEPGITRAAKVGLGILIRSGFAGGDLTPRVKTLLEKEENPELERIKKLLKILDGKIEWLLALALQFLRRNPDITSVLIGSKSVEHLNQDLRLLSIKLPKDVWEKVEKASG